MKITEKLLWILDERNNKFSLEKRCEMRIDFCHSLGLKCDAVGWCDMDLSRTDADEILNKIETYAKKENMLLRGYYSREFWNFNSEWYILKTKGISPEDWHWVEVVDNQGNSVDIEEVKAYKIPKFTSVAYTHRLALVSESFRNSCMKFGLEGIDFYWAKDVGKYDATQFFGVLIKESVPEFACDVDINYSINEKKIKKNQLSTSFSKLGELEMLAGYLPRLTQMFYDLRVSLPIQVPKYKMPDSDFAYTYLEEIGGRNKVLIRQNAADILLNEKVICGDDLEPVVLYDSSPNGYTIKTTDFLALPSEEFIDKLNCDYQLLKAHPKPKRKASQKDALKLFSKIKKNNSNFFSKGRTRKLCSELIGTAYEAMIPFYSISSSASLSNEYEMLHYEDVVLLNEEFEREMKTEELLEDKIEGIVIAICADGDTVILCLDNSVVRVSHETMCEDERWETLEQFFYDVLEES